MPYLGAMLARTVTLLAALLIAMATAVASPHAAAMADTMSGMTMETAIHGADGTCKDGTACEVPARKICAYICACLASFHALPVDANNAGPAVFGPAVHGIVADTDLAGHLPGLNERPPKAGLS